MEAAGVTSVVLVVVVKKVAAVLLEIKFVAVWVVVVAVRGAVG